MSTALICLAVVAWVVAVASWLLCQALADDMLLDEDRRGYDDETEANP